ncbi:P-loop NTPase fold protein [Chitinophaga filiformis]|uniref:KAP family P-loop domain-containing protein n=1 Tax=Chitinophaga filiformis TaxID=104663 RepID=A0A1G7SNC0_CHIFI|nr:P-loop NTPase fold protein [Chitinophaga filiformis]SDG23750.1 KAP family P-loop domain-containing protein [Chitinophaga filiformis]
MRFDQIFEYPIKEFIKHLEQADNERIVFSGKYGSGKTTFIKDFFEEENQKKIFDTEKYIPIHLFPVNYSIASNEDIIRYIKYDLIIQFLIKGICPKEVQLRIIDTLPAYIRKDLLKIATTIVSMVPKIGKDVVEDFEKLNELVKLFFEFHDKANETDGDKMINYLNKLQASEGSLFENDVITKIISETIKSSGKIPILIIDDLDRLDPEHTFRILNVFAAHFDTELRTGEKNKFGFEKIILVCDFRNIKRIFLNKYGAEVDFLGYVDKFYSSDVYHFDNKAAVADIIIQILKSIRYHHEEGDNEYIQKIYLGSNFIQRMLELFLRKDLVSLRNLIKLHNITVKFHNETIQFPGRRDRYAAQLPLTTQLKLIRHVISDIETLYSFIDKCAKGENEIENYDIYAANFFHILKGDEHFHNRRAGYVALFEDNEVYVDFENDFRTDRVQYVNLSKVKFDNDNNPQKGDFFNIKPDFFWKVMKATVEKLERVGYIG